MTMASETALEESARVQLATIDSRRPLVWLAAGWRDLQRAPLPGLLHGLCVTAFGLVLLALAHRHFWLLAGAFSGFLLVGPALLAGFFAVRRVAATRPPRLADLLGGFAAAPRGVWALAAVCALLFLIWMSDAATVYSFMIGDTRPGADQVWRFHAWTSLMGGVFALIVFHITATVAALPEQFSNTATIATGITESDGATANNSATVATRAIVFASGFEDAAIAPNDTTALHTRYLADTHQVENVSCELADYNMYAQDTALRDINQLVAWGVLQRLEGGGRSVGYGLTGQ